VFSCKLPHHLFLDPKLHVIVRHRRPAALPHAGSRPQPTLAEVADLAGVSSATVSRYINSPERVAGPTAERVRDAIAQTGYVPNLLAGGLASNRSRLVAALAPSFSQSIFSTTIQAMTDELSAAGYHVFLGLIGLRNEHIGPVLDSVLGRRPDGLILTGAALTPELRRRLLTSGPPVIETWDLPADPLDMAVGFSHEAVGRAVAAYALERGYKRPFLVSADGVRSGARRKGFIDAFMEHRRPAPPFAVFDVPITFGQGRQALAEFLDGGGQADVVVCSSDWTAHGVIAEAHVRGLRVPEDLAVIGFGDLEFAADLSPALTTVQIDGSAIGRQAAAFLLQRTQGLMPEARVVDVGFNLIRRASA